MAATKMSDAERAPLKDAIVSYALDCLEKREVKQLYELLRRPNDNNLVVPQVVDKVGGMITDTDVYIRNLATKVYVELLKRNPEFSTKERMDRLDSQVKIDMFERLCDPDLKKREEAREFVKYVFGVSTEVSKALGGEEGLLKFHPTKQRREAFRLLESFAEEVKGTKLDANAVFDEVRKLSKETGQHEFIDFKMMVRIAKNLLPGEGNVEEYNECLEASFKLYRGINNRIEEARSGVKKGDHEWVTIVDKVFKDWVPELARTMGYAHLTKGLEVAVEEVKKEEPEHIRRTILEILEKGKAS
ncbi:hypothetical protein H0N99_00210 [Candidatus Micrarchaeota archaeon]|nr:hypothetical protein [Candidatus Micrarchaeota archaeon]